jgi:hypothetical protein
MNLSLQVENKNEHTRILRVMLATEDCVSYWKAPQTKSSKKERAHLAFEQRWFGSKSESRVKTLLGDMALRFDAFPTALTALRTWLPPHGVAPWLCHLHTQLADPIYRIFTGEFLPKRRSLGYASVDKDIVARWVQETWPGRWSAATCIKFGGNMLATAYEAGLLKDRKDPRKLSTPRPPKQAIEYLLYLLRETTIQESILTSSYLRSIAPDAESLESGLRGVDAVRLQSVGEIRNLEWQYPSLQAWAEAQATTEWQEASA